MTTTPKLTDTQLVLLSAAAQHEDQLVVLPERLKGGAAKASLSKLLSLTGSLPLSFSGPCKTCSRPISAGVAASGPVPIPCCWAASSTTVAIQ